MENLYIVLADKEASDRRKLVSKWHPTTKGTLRRNYRVPSKSEGRRLLKALAALLSDDDHFRDATSHKVLNRNFLKRSRAPYLNVFLILTLYYFFVLISYASEFHFHNTQSILWVFFPRAVKLEERMLMEKACVATM